MGRGLLFVAAAAAAVLIWIVNMRDPAEQFAVPSVVVAAAVATGALASFVALHLDPARSTRGRASVRARRISLRRGAEIGGAVALLAILRAADGLTPLTGAFVLLAFVAAEAVVSARGA
ncbi:MAG: hypothetical protein ABR525_00850 [Candidatus Limnocylindria bacterium]